MTLFFKPRSFGRFLRAAVLALCLSRPVLADVPLWSLRGPDGGRAVLMGTIHLLPDTSEWQSRAMKRAIAGADLLVLEALVDGAEGAQLRQYTMAQGFTGHAEEWLYNILSPADVARLRAVEDSLHVPAGAFDRMRPWFAALNLSIVYATHHGFAADSGAEQWLRDAFRKNGRTIGGLESPTAGVALLANLDRAVQKEMLLSTIMQVEAGGDGILELYNAWRDGDSAKLLEITTSPEQFHPDVHDAILVQRNANWVEPVLDYLKTPEHEFIAVGAGHLVGPGNLIEMLENAGVTVEPLE